MLWLDLGEYRGPSRFHAFVMFCAARRRRRAIEQVYAAYVTDSLQGIPQGKFLQRRFSDLTKTREDIDVDAVIDHVARAMSSGD